LHLVGYLYYWQMGFNSVFKGLRRACFLVSHFYYYLWLFLYCALSCFGQYNCFILLYYIELMLY